MQSICSRHRDTLTPLNPPGFTRQNLEGARMRRKLVTSLFLTVILSALPRRGAKYPGDRFLCYGPVEMVSQLEHVIPAVGIVSVDKIPTSPDLAKV
jgi:hypothetical protein